MNELPSDACAIAADKGWYPTSHKWIKNDSSIPQGWGCCALGAVMMLQPDRSGEEGSQYHRATARKLDIDKLVRPGTQSRTMNAFDNFVDFWLHSKGEHVWPSAEEYAPLGYIKGMGVDAGLHGPNISLNEMEDAFAAMSHTDVWRAAARMLKTRGC